MRNITRKLSQLLRSRKEASSQMDETTNPGVDDNEETGSIKFCVDCKHYKFEDNSKKRKELQATGETMLLQFYLDKHWCHHPSLEITDIVTGETKANERECYDMRMRGKRWHDNSICGYRGKFWESKE